MRCVQLLLSHVTDLLSIPSASLFKGEHIELNFGGTNSSPEMSRKLSNDLAGHAPSMNAAQVAPSSLAKQMLVQRDCHSIAMHSCPSTSPQLLFHSGSINTSHSLQHQQPLAIDTPYIVRYQPAFATNSALATNPPFVTDSTIPYEMYAIDKAIKATSTFTPPLNPILQAIKDRSPLKYWRLGVITPPFNALEILKRLASTNKPRIRNIKVESKPHFSNGPGKQIQLWVDVVLEAMITPDGPRGNSFCLKTRTIANSEEEGTPIVAEKMLALLWEDPKCVRKYYYDVPNFFDHLELATFWPPCSNEPKFMQSFIQWFNTPRSTAKEWDQKMKEATRRTRRKEWYSHEDHSGARVCKYCLNITRAKIREVESPRRDEVLQECGVGCAMG
ncbi:uncharacterized protein PAC_01174 [Phialocephala subalpina]|uniref:Uncharacterized protein n=1 Tax=Phialocephala subalpina TaxID=576137 RepID=A0A1L7WEZ9_9HELO|nr:uncharacterized protein PAC_01174 [Phialocephala subalpina]